MAVAKEVIKERIPLKCYACGEYDGVFGPTTEEHTHVCKKCKELPTNLTGPIDKHAEQYDKLLYEQGGLETQRYLVCEKCDQDRDECLCSDNPLHQRS